MEIMKYVAGKGRHLSSDTSILVILFFVFLTSLMICICLFAVSIPNGRCNAATTDELHTVTRTAKRY